VPDKETRKRLDVSLKEIVMQNPPNPKELRTTIQLVLVHLSTSLLPVHLHRVQYTLDKNIHNTSAVYTAMTKIFERVWYYLVKDKKIPDVWHVPECAKVAIPCVEKHASSLAAVALLNKRVHVERYNTLIAQGVENALRVM
jgi:hypothetical protein